MIRIGIAGIGFMGMIHFLAYQKVRGARVVALCESNAKRLAGDWRDIRGNFGPPGTQMDLSGLRTYSDLVAMLADDQLDLIDVTLPPALHADVTCRALASGKHVFCEKPMSLTIGSCRRMTRAAKAAKRQLLVGHVLPFFPEYAWALRTIRSGRYGQLRGGSFKRITAEPLWLKNYWNADQVGGPMMDLHVHDAHFIRLLFGMPARVMTSGSTHAGLPKFWHSLFDFNGGDYVVEATSGTIDQQGRSFCHGFEIRLERATLMFEFAVLGGEGRYLCPPTILDSRGKVKQVKLTDGDPLVAFQAELREVVRSVSTGTPSDVLGGDLAQDAVLVCQKQAESLAAGKPVRIPASAD
jgi:predicted dehydrogenase